LILRIGLNSVDSVGLEEIPLNFLKLFIHDVLPFITHIFNTVITSGKFFVAWKLSRVVPIAKISDILDPKDYRRVSTLPVLSKALKIVMYSRALSHFQPGFDLVFLLLWCCLYASLSEIGPNICFSESCCILD
jgi:hypothetical protein